MGKFEPMLQGEKEDCQLGIRWTVGDVNDAGFEALQLSICGAHQIFGFAARYLVCVNSIGVDMARKRTGALPVAVEWRQVSRNDLPLFLRMGNTVAEGTGWKFCPLRAFDDLPELALDNDCILWRLPPAIERWLNRQDGCLIAEDVRPHFGRFASQCGPRPRNSGIRGFTPGFPFEQGLSELMRNTAGELLTEGDEQGLQVACLHALGTPELVTVEDVTICSPFPPHVQFLGKCGVHFVGLNTRQFDWAYYGRNPGELIREHWHRMKPAIAAKIG